MYDTTPRRCPSPWLLHKYSLSTQIHKQGSKGVHWDTENKRLHKAGKTFCYIERVGSHWALEHNPILTPAGPISVFASNSSAPRKDIEAAADRWHALLGDPGHEAVAHLQQNVTGAVFTTAKPLQVACEPCALSKAQRIISRRSEKSELATESLARVAYDLIPIDIAYNMDKWVSHFKCYFSGMDFVYTHSKKSQSTDIVVLFSNRNTHPYQRHP